MSRRHQGGRPHRPGGHGRPSAAPLAAPSADAQRHRPEPGEPNRPQPPSAGPTGPLAAQPFAPIAAQPSTMNASAPVLRPEPDVPQTAPPASLLAQPPLAVPPDPANPQAGPLNGGQGLSMGSSCTAPQLRRFIKSRPYVPMHELRRRFAINGGDDDVTAVDLAGGRVFVGLPAREGDLLGELLRGGEVGFELSLDPRSPIVVGLYPMRPIPRP